MHIYTNFYTVTSSYENVFVYNHFYYCGCANILLYILYIQLLLC